MNTLNITIETVNNEYVIWTRAYKDNKPLFEDKGRIYTIVDNYQLAIDLCNKAVKAHNASDSIYKAVFNSPEIA